MKKTTLLATLGFSLLPMQVVRPGELAGFRRGYIYVTYAESEACDFGGREWIVEIDPSDGSWRIFADSDDGLCGASGLRFTPSGDKLLVVNFGHVINGLDGGWIQAFNPDGTSDIILDASDGLRSPSGANALDFDRDGNLYVLSGDTQQILRFPGNGGPATVFADNSDGITFQGALSFAPNGELFFGSSRSLAILRILPDGQSLLFDDVGLLSMDVDQCGNLYSVRGDGVFRYEQLDGESRKLLTAQFPNVGSKAIASSPDGREVYLAQLLGEVYRIDPNDGSASMFVDLTPELTRGAATPYGMAVFAPRVPGDSDGDGDVDLRDATTLQRCWTDGEIMDLCCHDVDMNGDARLDAADGAAFLPVLTGPR